MYTAMHGVGYRYVNELLHHFHLPEVAIVSEQIEPDPSFPTVSFPNPEEKGALDLAMKMADKEGIEYVMATDPDADRFICCQKTNNGVGFIGWFDGSGMFSKVTKLGRYLAIICVYTVKARNAV